MRTSIPVIDAVLNYQKHDYLFFCAKSDFSGGHHFSKTLRQHNQYATNLEAYQAGHHATKILTLGAQHFAVTFGGTGATLVITLEYRTAFQYGFSILRRINNVGLLRWLSDTSH